MTGATVKPVHAPSWQRRLVRREQRARPSAAGTRRARRDRRRRDSVTVTIATPSVSSNVDHRHGRVAGRARCRRPRAPVGSSGSASRNSWKPPGQQDGEPAGDGEQEQTYGSSWRHRLEAVRSVRASTFAVVAVSRVRRRRPSPRAAPTRDATAPRSPGDHASAGHARRRARDRPRRPRGRGARRAAVLAPTRRWRHARLPLARRHRPWRCGSGRPLEPPATMKPPRSRRPTRSGPERCSSSASPGTATTPSFQAFVDKHGTHVPAGERQPRRRVRPVRRAGAAGAGRASTATGKVTTMLGAVERRDQARDVDVLDRGDG